jgi:hypothetical protein
MPVTPARGMSNPFGSIPVAGYINLAHRGEYLFDYNAGVLTPGRGVAAIEMPENINARSPMPLWNLALEIHTGRFYSIVLGKYYILFIPLAGIFILTILITGLVLWIKNYRRKKRSNRNQNKNTIKPRKS